MFCSFLVSEKTFRIFGNLYMNSFTGVPACVKIYVHKIKHKHGGSTEKEVASVKFDHPEVKNGKYGYSITFKPSGDTSLERYYQVKAFVNVQSCLQGEHITEGDFYTEGGVNIATWTNKITEKEMDITMLQVPRTSRPPSPGKYLSISR